MSDPLSPQDLAVRREILRALARDVAVTRVSVMQALGCEYAEVSASYARLAAAHVIVLDAGERRGVDGAAVLGGADAVPRRRR